MRRMLLHVVAMIMVVAVSGPAYAQTGQIFGEIVGKVGDGAGGVLPGVAVSLTGPAVMGARTATTNEAGQYRFPGVNPGTFTVRFELSGFATLVRTDVVVSARTTVTIDADMKIATLEETVTVTGASPIVDVESAKVGARFDAALLESVPTAKQIYSTVTLAPAVVNSRQDPGGINPTSKNFMIAHGVNTFAMNYFGVTADTPQNYGQMYYVDMNATDELSIDTAAMAAEIGGGGGANINVIPKSGGNNVDGKVEYAFINRDFGMIDRNVTPELQALGLADLNLTMLRDGHYTVGGPIKADRVWYFGSYQNFTSSEVVSRFPLPGVRGMRSGTARLTRKAGTNGQLSGLFLYNKRIVHYAGGGITNPDPISTTEQRSPKNMYVGNYTTVLDQNTFLEAVVSHFDLKNPFGYTREWYAIPEAERRLIYPSVNLTTAINSGPPAGASTFDSDRFQMNFALTKYQYGWLGANHQYKMGFENYYGYGGTGRDHWNGVTLAYRNDAAGVPQPVQFDVQNTPLRQRNSLRYFGGFAQDRISFSRLTLNLGLRWSYADGKLREQVGGGNEWFPRVTYPAIDPGFAWNTVVPRVSAVFKLDEDGRTVLKSSFSQYVPVLYTQTFDTINPNIIRAQGLATYRWFGDRNSNGIIDAGEYDPNPIARFTPASNAVDPDLKNPLNTEYTVGVEREVARGLGVSVLWLERRFTGNYADVNVGIPSSAYIPRTFNDPGPDNIVSTADDRPITLYDVAPAFIGKDAFMRKNVEGTGRYRSLEFMANKRLSNNWQLSGSYVWSRAYGVLMGVAGATVDDRLVYDPTNPNLALNTRSGRQAGIDQPHQTKIVASYQAPWDISIGTIYQGLSGLPRDRQFRATLSQGVTTVLAEERGTYRADFVNLVSLSADKRVRLPQSRNIRLRLEVHNLANTHAADAGFGTLTAAFASEAALRAAQAGSATYFGRVTSIVAPRLMKVSVGLDF
jgi:hypothetical protein